MKRLDRYLYDNIGREYPRLNQYLDEMASLETQLSQNKGDPQAQAKLSQLKNEGENHPYNKALRDFKGKETTFLSKLKTLAPMAGPGDEKLRLAIAQAKAKEEFYAPYEDLSWDARYEYRKAKINHYHLPQLLTFQEETKNQLAKDEASLKALSTAEIEAGQKEAAEQTARVKRHHDEALAKSKASYKAGNISAKALSNRKGELKNELKHGLSIASLANPKTRLEESIKSGRYELKQETKSRRNILQSDLADLRRVTPMETTKRTPWKYLLTLPIPGLGQLLNGQPIKALLFFLGTLFIYLTAIPYALGYGNYVGNGIMGLFDLGKDGARNATSIMFMIEGLIAVALLLMALVIFVTSFLDVRKTEKDAIAGIRPRNWFETKTGLANQGFPFLITVPALVALLFLVLLPLSTTILLSFTNMNPQNQAKFSWAGLRNYVQLFTGQGAVGEAFLRIFGWTMVWTLVGTTSAILTGFILALLTNNPRIRGKRFFRTIFLLPWAVPAFITIMFFSLMVAPNGIITRVISDIAAFFGHEGLVLIKNNATLTRIALILLQTWLGSAYIFLLSTGVMQAIPEDLYEAAQIDGASTWQKLRRITLPLILFQTGPLLIGQYTFNFNNFSVIKLFNNGGPFDPAKYGNLGGASDLLITYIYTLILQKNHQAMGAAITMIISLALMLFTFIGFKNSKAFKEERL